MYMRNQRTHLYPILAPRFYFKSSINLLYYISNHVFYCPILVCFHLIGIQLIAQRLLNMIVNPDVSKHSLWIVVIIAIFWERFWPQKIRNCKVLMKKKWLPQEVTVCHRSYQSFETMNVISHECINYLFSLDPQP